VAKDPRTVLTEAANIFIAENAGAWASSIIPYVPGMVQAQLAMLAGHGLHIDTIPAVQKTATPPITPATPPAIPEK
jgi:hypothetical protein